MTRHAILYIPGLGDRRNRGQRLALATWKIWGVRTEFVPMNWHESETLGTKLARIDSLVDAMVSEGYTVSLVGVSAGASATMNAYATRQDVIHRVVCICGTLNGTQHISAGTFHSNPGFSESMAKLQGSLLSLGPEKRHRLLSIHPLADESVPIRDTFVQDAVIKQIPTMGHFLSITIAITLYSWSIVRFIKRP